MVATMAASPSMSSHLAHRDLKSWRLLHDSQRGSSSCKRLEVARISSTRSSSEPPVLSLFFNTKKSDFAKFFQHPTCLPAGTSKKSFFGISNARAKRCRSIASLARPKRSIVDSPSLSASDSLSGNRIRARSMYEARSQDGMSYARASSIRRMGGNERDVSSSIAYARVGANSHFVARHRMLIRASVEWLIGRQLDEEWWSPLDATERGMNGRRRT